MSEIVVSTQNLSKFNRRAQKAVQNVLNTPVSLSQAQEIVAQIIGTRSYHELQEVIKSTPKPFKATELVKKISQCFNEIPMPSDLVEKNS